METFVAKFLQPPLLVHQSSGDAVHVEHRLLEGITSSRYPSNIALQKLTVWAEGGT